MYVTPSASQRLRWRRNLPRLLVGALSDAPCPGGAEGDAVRNCLATKEHPLGGSPSRKRSCQSHCSQPSSSVCKALALQPVAPPAWARTGVVPPAPGAHKSLCPSSNQRSPLKLTFAFA